MKKNMLLGMAAVLALSMAAVQPALASRAAARPASIRDSLTRDLDIGKGKIKSVNDQTTETARKSLAVALEGISKDATQKDLISVMGKTLELGNNAINAQSGSRITVESIARSLAKTHELLKEVNRNDLDTASREYVATLEKYVKSSTAFLSTYAVSARMDAVRSPEVNRQLEGYEKQLALILEIPKMNKEDMETHIRVMEKTVENKVSAETRGEAAFYKALVDLYKEKAQAKLAEVTGCRL